MHGPAASISAASQAANVVPRRIANMNRSSFDACHHSRIPAHDELYTSHAAWSLLQVVWRRPAFRPSTPHTADHPKGFAVPPDAPQPRVGAGEAGRISRIGFDGLAENADCFDRTSRSQ